MKNAPLTLIISLACASVQATPRSLQKVLLSLNTRSDRASLTFPSGDLYAQAVSNAKESFAILQEACAESNELAQHPIMKMFYALYDNLNLTTLAQHEARALQDDIAAFQTTLLNYLISGERCLSSQLAAHMMTINAMMRQILAPQLYQKGSLIARGAHAMKRNPMVVMATAAGLMCAYLVGGKLVRVTRKHNDTKKLVTVLSASQTEQLTTILQTAKDDTFIGSFNNLTAPEQEQLAHYLLPRLYDEQNTKNALTAIKYVLARLIDNPADYQARKSQQTLVKILESAFARSKQPQQSDQAALLRHRKVLVAIAAKKQTTTRGAGTSASNGDGGQRMILEKAAAYQFLQLTYCDKSCWDHFLRQHKDFKAWVQAYHPTSNISPIRHANGVHNAATVLAQMAYEHGYYSEVMHATRMLAQLANTCDIPLAPLTLDLAEGQKLSSASSVISDASSQSYASSIQSLYEAYKTDEQMKVFLDDQELPHAGDGWNALSLEQRTKIQAYAYALKQEEVIDLTNALRTAATRV